MKKSKLANLLSLAPQPKPRKPLNRLQAHAHRLAPSAYEDYDEEPTTKLSTAFVVVLVLHVVAVGGIYAFHSIKAKRREADGTATTASASPAPASSGSVAPAAVASQPVAANATPVATVPGVPVAKAPVQALPKTDVAALHLPVPTGPSAVVSQKPGAPQGAQSAQSQVAVTAVAGKAQAGAAPSIKAVAAVAPSAQSPAPVQAVASDSAAKTYVVAKGDNPVAIAKKMGVNYEEMLKLNGIEDPRKLRIGQVLKMPAKKQGH